MEPLHLGDMIVEASRDVLEVTVRDGATEPETVARTFWMEADVERLMAYLTQWLAWQETLVPRPPADA